ncbi:MAG: hypothetical protein KatS3mg027_1553 [Bacteroidia bacterium]|nr:MAG: hypothetical protein KatS3mg027_1553 [Bacteroidia bacterium]
MRIAIIGSGRLGYHLAKRLNACHYDVVVVNHRENEVLQRLSSEGIQTEIGYRQLNTADIVVFCIKDDLIEELVNKLYSVIKKDAVVVHTSGTIDSVVLKVFENYGVLYPLYSFTLEEEVQWHQIPIYYVSCNAYSREVILSIANSLNERMVYEIDDEQKRLIHLLAVFSNNFTNTLAHCIYTLSDNNTLKNLDVYNKMISFAIQSLMRVRNSNPSHFQTGPAVRGDKKTIQQHLEYLNQYTEITNIYNSFTAYITNIIKNERKEK